jgi:hypothetical protein
MKPPRPVKERGYSLPGRPDGKGNMRVTARPRRPWSSDDDDRLRLGMKSGKSAPAIAADLERTTRSVRRRTEILKLSWKGKPAAADDEAKPRHVGSTSVKAPLVASPRWTPEEDDRFRRLAGQGGTASSIAEQLKRTRAAVYTRAKRLDVRLVPEVKLKPAPV